MSGLLQQEIERLERALDRLEAAIGQLESRHRAELDAAIDHARADARKIAARIDGAIERLETVLEG